MSGPICPKCGCPSLRSVKGGAQCEFCSWVGDLSGRPRKMLTQESYRRWSEKLSKMRAGKLFIVTIEVDESINSNVISDVMRVLKIRSLSHRGGPDSTKFINIEIEEKSDEMLDKLRQVKGVVSISIHP